MLRNPTNFFFGLYGIQSVGKTTFTLALLNMLIKDKEFEAIIEQGDKYYMKLLQCFYDKHSIPQTPPGKTYDFTIYLKFREKKYRITLTDISGVDLIKMKPIVKLMTHKKDCHLFFIEPSSKIEMKIRQIMLMYKIISLITKMFKKRTDKPLAIILTKNDIYNIKDPHNFFWEYTRDIINLAPVLSLVENYEFFAISAFSCLKRMDECNIKKLFFWLIENV